MADLFTPHIPDGTGQGKSGPPRDRVRHRPLADVLRPRSLGEVLGQDHVLGPEGSLSRLVAAGHLPSLVFWGPPGIGKTTIARLLSDAAGLEFLQISAVFSGVSDLRKLFDHAREFQRAGRGVLLFVDEIHRFNRAQQDAFLPFVEEGLVTLIGATTENPSFELNGALLSRMQVVVLKRLDGDALEALLQRAETHFGTPLPLTPAGREALIAMADGDGRFLLNLAEGLAALRPAAPAGPTELAELLRKRAPAYDKDREEHYNLISALHKSVRGSDPDAALYWFARMLEGGEDPLFIARRLIRMASEDIGLADPTALLVTVAARSSYEALGSPEGELALAQAVLHLAAAPKSNSAYTAYKAARALAKATGSAPPPDIILNAPTRMMQEIGRGKDYRYDHDEEDGFSGQNYFPDGIKRPLLYRPGERGREKDIAARLEKLAALRRTRAASGKGGDESGG